MIYSGCGLLHFDVCLSLSLSHTHRWSDRDMQTDRSGLYWRRAGKGGRSKGLLVAGESSLNVKGNNSCTSAVIGFSPSALGAETGCTRLKTSWLFLHYKDDARHLSPPALLLLVCLVPSLTELFTARHTCCLLLYQIRALSQTIFIN